MSIIKSALFNEFGRVLTLSGPLMLAMSGHTIMMIVDRLCLAAYSEQTLIASGPAVFTAMIAISFFVGITHIGRSVIAHQFTAKGVEKAKEVGGEILILATLCGIAFAFSMPFLIWIAEFSSRPHEIITLERNYLWWAILFGIVMIFNSAITCFFGALGNTKLVFKATAIGQMISIIATYTLVFGKFGFPQLGMSGSAIGTLIGALSTFWVYFVYLPTKLKQSAMLTLQKAITLKTNHVMQRFKKGLPIGAHNSADEIGNTAILWATSILGTTALAANNFNIILNYISIIPILGIANGATILSSQALGNKDHSRVINILLASIAISLVYILFVASVLQTFALEITQSFNLASYSVEIFNLSISVTHLLWIYALSFLISFICSGVLQSFDKNNFVFRTRILVMWLGSVPSAFYIATHSTTENGGLQKIWISLSLFELAIWLIFLTKVLYSIRQWPTKYSTSLDG